MGADTMQPTTPVSLCKQDVRPSEWTGDGEGAQVRVEGYRETCEGGCLLGKHLSTPQPVTITDSGRTK
jgi:hypothetical protein